MQSQVECVLLLECVLLIRATDRKQKHALVPALHAHRLHDLEWEREGYREVGEGEGESKRILSL
jgi:hypothetical protein